MANDLLAIVSSSNSPVVIVVVAADEAVADAVVDPVQDPLEVDMTDVMNDVAVDSVEADAAAADDHIEPNGQCWLKIFHRDAGKINVKVISCNKDPIGSPFRPKCLFSPSDFNIELNIEFL